MAHQNRSWHGLTVATKLPEIGSINQSVTNPSTKERVTNFFPNYVAMGTASANFKIVLDPTASVEAITEMLLKTRCDVVDGSVERAELWVGVKFEGNAVEVATQLTTSPLIRKVEICEK